MGGGVHPHSCESVPMLDFTHNNQLRAVEKCHFRDLLLQHHVQRRNMSSSRVYIDLVNGKRRMSFNFDKHIIVMCVNHMSALYV